MWSNRQKQFRHCKTKISYKESSDSEYWDSDDVGHHGWSDECTVNRPSRTVRSSYPKRLVAKKTKISYKQLSGSECWESDDVGHHGSSHECTVNTPSRTVPSSNPKRLVATKSCNVVGNRLDIDTKTKELSDSEYWDSDDVGHHGSSDEGTVNRPSSNPKRLVATKSCSVVVNRLEIDTLSKYRCGPYVSAKWIAHREHFRRTLNGCPEHFIAVALKSLDNLINAQRRWRKSSGKELKTAKRELWCGCCLQLSTIVCCWTRSYCCEECQMMDWDTHRPYCRRPMKIDIATQS